MSSSTPPSRNDDDVTVPRPFNDPNPPTVAVFSPVTLSRTSALNKQRSTILVHQKSPLLIATPPQITRTLAYSHPFLLPLNQLAGLLTWTSGDPCESFLLVAVFWGVVLYGDLVLRWAGPIVFVVGLILGMYSRRYSPLSSTGWTGEKQNYNKKSNRSKNDSELTSTKHQKTLDEIVETLKMFTSRCNVLLEPLLELTDFLSTQRTATSATTRPALTTLFLRILMVTPIWVLLTLPSVGIITGRRVVLVAGTLFLTWHSRPNRVSRTILWRSALVRRTCAAVTGLHFSGPQSSAARSPNNPNTTAASSSSSASSQLALPPRGASSINSKPGASLAGATTSTSTISTSSSLSTANMAASSSSRRSDAPGVRFTFILYENQRRWVGLGWTSSLFAYERAAWTDEHLNAATARDELELPEVEAGAGARWRWVRDGRWRVEGAAENDEGGSGAASRPSGSGSRSDGGMGWIYYDNKWQNGRRGVDGWGRYTRRRKWYRDAELVEITPSTEATPQPSPALSATTSVASAPSSRPQSSSSNVAAPPPPPEYAEAGKEQPQDDSSVRSGGGGSGGFRSGSVRRRGTGSARSVRSTKSAEQENDEEEGEMLGRGVGVRREREGDWGIGDDARMGLE